MVRHGRKADCAQENRVVVADPLQTVFRHHPPVLEEILATPGKLLPLQPKAVSARGCVEHAHPLGDHLLANAISWDHRDLEALHGDYLTSTREKHGAREYILGVV